MTGSWHLPHFRRCSAEKLYSAGIVAASSVQRNKDAREATGVVNARPIRVVVVDDHHLFRSGLAMLLEEHGLRVVGDAAGGAQAAAMTVRLAPDVVLMGLNMPGMSSVEAIRQVTSASPATRVIVLIGSGAPRDVTNAILAGARGYLRKDASIEQIVQAVRAAAAGEPCISRTGAAALLTHMRLPASRERPRARHGPASDDSSAPARLTRRELEILRLVAAGRSNADIAAELVISSLTVKNHVSNILAKLEIRNRTAAAVYAARMGMI
jgi:DNA-binding NarL/FixJ family response regulator